MKKTALLLVIVMLLGISLAFTACGGSDNDAPSVEDTISNEIKTALMTKIALQSATSGKSLYYHTHTVSVRELGNNTYSVSGTATAMSSGTKYTADYEGTAEYNPATGECDVDIDVERFS